MISTPYANQGTAQAAAIAAPVTAGQAGITTMSDQLGNVLNQGGPLMQQAATQGNQQAAQRGLLNSSMGIQAAQGAVLSQATQIAQNDMNALNQGNQFNTSQSNAVSLENQKSANQANQFNTQQGNAMNQWNAGQQNELIKSTMDINSHEQLANIEANYKNLLQTSSSASGMYEQYLKNMSDISQSDISADAKANGLANQVAYLRSGLQMMSNLSGVQNLVTF